MSKRFLAVVLLLTLLAAGGWALAQENRGQNPGSNAPKNLPRGLPATFPGQPAASGVPAAPGRYAVVQVGAQAVLLDTATGKTWLLQPGGQGRAVWVPARRLDSDKEVQGWQEEHQDRGAQREKAREEEQRALQAREAALRAELEALQQRARAQEEQARRREEEARRAVEEVLRQLQKKQPLPK